MAVGYGQATPKTVNSYRRGKNAKKRAEWKRSKTTRDYVFGRERNTCRICRCRRAETMHELIFRSQRGKVSASNSVAVCGDGVRGCHGFAQRHEIGWEGSPVGAEGSLIFTPNTKAAADWMRVKLGHAVKSDPMLMMETAE